MSTKPANRQKTGFRGPSPDVGKQTQFQKGTSGNPSGRPKTSPITEILREIFEDDREMVKEQLKKVMRGKSGMAKVMLTKDAAERLEGKVAQPVQVSGELTVSLADEMRKGRERVVRIKESE